MIPTQASDGPLVRGQPDALDDDSDTGRRAVETREGVTFNLHTRLSYAFRRIQNSVPAVTGILRENKTAILSLRLAQLVKGS